MSYHEGSNWQARKEDAGEPLYSKEERSPLISDHIRKKIESAADNWNDEIRPHIARGMVMGYLLEVSQRPENVAAKENLQIDILVSTLKEAQETIKWMWNKMRVENQQDVEAQFNVPANTLTHIEQTLQAIELSK